MGIVSFISVVSSLLLTATPGDGQAEVKAPASAESSWSIEARSARLSDLIEQLRAAGISVAGAPADAERLVSGEFSGDLPTLLARMLRHEDFTLSQAADGYEIRFLSGIEGETGMMVRDAAPARVGMPVLTASGPGTAAADRSRSGTMVATLLDTGLAQAAASGERAAGLASDAPQRPADAGSPARSAPSSMPDPEQIAALNARAAEQLSALVTALQASCPAGRSCD